jgi:CitMHS family citrate-Mg2+:H+ or citrate-Ca2+:H+ symporter
VFLPLVPAVLAGLAATFALAWYFGMSERRRLDWAPSNRPHEQQIVMPEAPGRRPQLFWFNLLLTLGLIVGMIVGVAPLPAMIMGAFAIAVTVNYPTIREQRERIAEHAPTRCGRWRTR